MLTSIVATILCKTAGIECAYSQELGRS